MSLEAIKVHVLLTNGVRSGRGLICGAINDGQHQGARRRKRTLLNNQNKRESDIGDLIVNVDFNAGKAVYGSCTSNSFSKNNIKMNQMFCFKIV